MKNLYFYLIATFLFTFHLHGEKVLESLPPRPLTGVSDISDWLTNNDKKYWESRIEQLLLESNIEMIIMILPVASANDIPLDVLFQRISKNWVTKKCCGVIIHTPGRADSPRVLMTGNAIQETKKTPSEIRDMIVKVEALSHVETTDEKRLNAAFDALKEQLLPFPDQFTELQAEIEKKRLNTYHINTTLEIRKKFELLLFWLVIPSFFVAIAYGFYRWYKYLQPVTFLSTSPRKRFCSPYSGGGGSSIVLNRFRKFRK
jgi:hypothetical protein